jgi:hypothetical protein
MCFKDDRVKVEERFTWGILVNGNYGVTVIWPTFGTILGKKVPRPSNRAADKSDQNKKRA